MLFYKLSLYIFISKIAVPAEKSELDVNLYILNKTFIIKLHLRSFIKIVALEELIVVDLY